MKKLKISKQDEYILSKYKVYRDKHSGYYRVSIGNSKYIYLHRFILNAKIGDIVDHKNMDKSDNRRENLRIVSNSLNCYNRIVKNNNGRGIYFDKSGERYRACISNKGKTLKLGSFKNVHEAKQAYNKKAFEIYGEDAYQHEI